MNPPYNKGLHIKILKEVQKFSNNIISLQPITFIQKSILFGEKREINNLFIAEKIPMNDCSKFFNINIRQDLGIFSSFCKKDCDEIIDNFNLLSKIKNTIINNNLLNSLLYNESSLNSSTFSIKVGYGVTVAGHSGEGKACYRICSFNKNTAFNKEISGHSKFINFNSENERNVAFNAYNLTLMRFIYKEFGFGGIPENYIFSFKNIHWKGMSGTIDGFNNRITNDMLYEYFNISLEERKYIEDVMEKYK